MLLMLSMQSVLCGQETCAQVQCILTKILAVTISDPGTDNMNNV